MKISNQDADKIAKAFNLYAEAMDYFRSAKGFSFEKPDVTFMLGEIVIVVIKYGMEYAICSIIDAIIDNIPED